MAEEATTSHNNSKSRFRFHWRIGRDVSLVVLTAFAAVGAVTAASTGIATVRNVNDISDSLEHIFDGTAEEAAKAADSNPSNAHITLVSADKQRYVDSVIGADGSGGYVLESNLEELEIDESYQLWARTPTGVISIGLLGAKIEPTYFTLPHSSTSFFLTKEAATGSIAPSSAALVEANLV